jgi:hypothetical protein
MSSLENLEININGKTFDTTFEYGVPNCYTTKKEESFYRCRSNWNTRHPSDDNLHISDIL